MLEILINDVFLVGMMAENAIIDVSAEVLRALGEFGIWLQTLGIIFLVWILFAFISFLMNRRRIAEVYKIKEDMKRIEGKIDKIRNKIDRM